jgi:hypothetical protein
MSMTTLRNCPNNAASIAIIAVRGRPGLRLMAPPLNGVVRAVVRRTTTVRAPTLLVNRFLRLFS